MPVASALISMLPFHPPLPTVRNLPFQFAGSHSSILMSDSLVGASVAATRQNAGRSAIGAPPRPPRPGAVNVPAATGCAIVMVTLGSFADDRLSHVAAAAGAAVAPIAPMMNAKVLFVIASPR